VGLRHRNIVRVHATGSGDRGVYIVMDFVVGGTLQERLDTEGKMEPRLAASILQQSLQGLHHAHEQGVVHRDLQPENIMLESDSTPRLVDFGIAVQIEEEEESSRGGVGTRGYVAPEQKFKGLAVDHRADIYGAGATLLAMLTGRIWGPAHELQPDSPGLEGVSEVLAAIVLKATCYSPEDRYQTAAEMGRCLAEAHATLQAKQPQEEPTIIMGDEDEDWAVLEQRRDFSEMAGPEALLPAQRVETVDSEDDSDLWLRILLALMLVAGFVSWWIGYR
jgi:serine/threonine protein kinase